MFHRDNIHYFEKDVACRPLDAGGYKELSCHDSIKNVLAIWAKPAPKVFNVFVVGMPCDRKWGQPCIYGLEALYFSANYGVGNSSPLLFLLRL